MVQLSEEQHKNQFIKQLARSQSNRSIRSNGSRKLRSLLALDANEAGNDHDDKILSANDFLPTAPAEDPFMVIRAEWSEAKKHGHPPPKKMWLTREQIPIATATTEQPSFPASPSPTTPVRKISRSTSTRSLRSHLAELSPSTPEKLLGRLQLKQEIESNRKAPLPCRMLSRSQSDRELKVEKKKKKKSKKKNTGDEVFFSAIDWTDHKKNRQSRAQTELVDLQKSKKQSKETNKRTQLDSERPSNSSPYASSEKLDSLLRMLRESNSSTEQKATKSSCSKTQLSSTLHEGSSCSMSASTLETERMSFSGSESSFSGNPQQHHSLSQTEHMGHQKARTSLSTDEAKFGSSILVISSAKKDPPGLNCGRLVPPSPKSASPRTLKRDDFFVKDNLFTTDKSQAWKNKSNDDVLPESPLLRMLHQELNAKQEEPAIEPFMRARHKHANATRNQRNEFSGVLDESPRSPPHRRSDKQQIKTSSASPTVRSPTTSRGSLERHTAHAGKKTNTRSQSMRRSDHNISSGLKNVLSNDSTRNPRARGRQSSMKAYEESYPQLSIPQIPLASSRNLSSLNLSNTLHDKLDDQVTFA